MGKDKARKSAAAKGETVEASQAAETSAWDTIPQLPPIFYALVVGIVSFAVSVNTKSNGFVFDDERGIVKNPDLRPTTPITNLLYNDYWGTPMTDFNSHKSYRPLTVLTFRLNYAFHELDPASYHVLNVIFHSITSIIFFFVGKTLLRDARASFIASLIFAVHTVHSEAIANVVGRAELVSGAFFLGTLWSYYNVVSPSLDGKWSFKWLLLSVFLSVCAMLSKEQGFLSIIVAAFYDAVIVHSLSPIEAVLVFVFGKVPAGRSTSWVSGLRKRLVILAVSSIALLIARLRMNAGASIPLNPNEHLVAFAQSRIVRALTLSYYVVVNFWLLVFPNHLCSDWSHETIPLLKSLTDPRVFLVLLFFVTAAVLVYRIYFSRGHADTTLNGVKLGVVMMVLTYLPSSGMFFNVGFVIAERVLYLPSIGYCLLLVFALSKLPRSVRVATAIVIVGLLSSRTIERNRDWESNFTIHEAGAKTCSNNVKLLANFGLELYSRAADTTRPEDERKRYLQEAESVYQKALKIDEYYVAACFNYGNLMQETGRLEEAAVIYEKSLSRPDISRATLGLLNNLASVYYYLQRYDKSEETFLKLLQLENDHQAAINGLASLYGTVGKYEKSEKYFKELIKLHPNYAEARFNYGTLLIRLDRLDEAEVQLLKTMELSPGHAKAKNNLDVIAYERKKKQQ